MARGDRGHAALGQLVQPEDPVPGGLSGAHEACAGAQPGTVFPSGGIGVALSMRAMWTVLWAIQPQVLRV